MITDVLLYSNSMIHNTLHRTSITIGRRGQFLNTVIFTSYQGIIIRQNVAFLKRTSDKLQIGIKLGIHSLIRNKCLN